MSSPLSSDPLEAVDLLVGEIAGSNGAPAEIPSLIRAIDLWIYSFLSMPSEDVPGIEPTEFKPPHTDGRQIYESVKHRYGALGNYWTALDPVMKEGVEGELAIGDAIDDLADILIALREVQWFGKHADRRNALAAMRFRYESHLWMHVHPLRRYLEEVKQNG